MLERDWTEPVIAAELADPDTQVFVGDSAGRTVGMCVLRPGPVPGSDDPATELCRLYIEPEYLGTGLGSALIYAVIGAADAGPHDRCWLIAWERNERALALYEQRGFRFAGTTIYAVGESVPTAVVMVRSRPDSAPATQP